MIKLVAGENSVQRLKGCVFDFTSVRLAAINCEEAFSVSLFSETGENIIVQYSISFPESQPLAQLMYVE